MTDLSLAALTVLDAGPAGQIRAAAAASFPSVGLRLQPLLATDVIVVGQTSREREVQALLAETGVRVLEVGVFPIRTEVETRHYDPVIVFCGRIGARYLVCPVENPDRLERLQAFRAVCDQALRHNVAALIEFNPYSACRTLADAVEIVEAANRQNAGLVIDAMHLSRSGGSPADLATVDPSLLRLVHLCDASTPPNTARSRGELRAESRAARRLPGEGALWLDELLDGLPSDVGMSIEAPSATTAHLSAAERAKRAYEVTQDFLARRSERARAWSKRANP